MNLFTICLNFIVLLTISPAIAQNRGAAEEQLNNFKKTAKGKSYITTGYGVPFGIRDAVLTVGTRGPTLLQDVKFIDQMAHFDRERIPERVVHAKGTGALGYFEVTKPYIQQYCDADLFDAVGKKTPIAVRFSQSIGESGSADTDFDTRGFAIKFYTKEGILDLLGFSTPMFFIRDAMLFSTFIHAVKRNPMTHLFDYDMFWDFTTLRPEMIFAILFVFSGFGTPDTYRHMNAFPINTFKFINNKGEFYWTKFHFLTNQGVKNLTLEQALNLRGKDPDYFIRDLYNAIGRGDFPSWSFKVQIMTHAEAEKLKYDPFDSSKLWSEKDFPLMEVGKIVLNKNNRNNFAEVEQLAFSPGNLVPGIEPSPDKILQGRLFAYPDTQRYRLGANHLQLPANCPWRFDPSIPSNNIQRDGFMCYENQGGAPNYYPNSYNDQLLQECERTRKLSPAFDVCGQAFSYSTKDEDNYSQASEYYNSLSSNDKNVLFTNLLLHIGQASKPLHKRAVDILRNVSKDLASRLAKGLNL